MFGVVCRFLLDPCVDPQERGHYRSGFDPKLFNSLHGVFCSEEFEQSVIKTKKKTEEKLCRKMPKKFDLGFWFCFLAEKSMKAVIFWATIELGKIYGVNSHRLKRDCYGLSQVSECINQ